jgi:hypothetical protein
VRKEAPSLAGRSPAPRERSKMKRQGSLRQVLGLSVLAATLAGSSGCITSQNATDTVRARLIAPLPADPGCGRDHVYIFFNHGMDPFDFAHLSDVRDYVQSLGYPKTYYGKLCPDLHFDSEICKIHKEDPCARFVLVGFSFGANRARDVAQAVKHDSINIDLLVYLGGNTLKNVPRDQPENVTRMINILANGCIWNGDTLERAENVQVQGVWHFGSPSHPYTLDLLAKELATVAATVPVSSLPEKIAAPKD